MSRVDAAIAELEDVVTTFRMTGVTGHASAPLPIPNQPWLMGMAVYSQWLVPAWPPLWASPALAMWIR